MTQSTACLLAFTLGILLITDKIQVWMVYALAFGHGLVNVFDGPARQTFLTELVGEKQLLNAVSLNSIQGNVARIIGPALAGILISTVGLALCFLLNGLSFIAVLIMLSLLDKKTLLPSIRSTQMKGKLTEGLHYAKHNPIIRNTLIMATIIGMFSFEFAVTLPLIAQFTFHDLTARTYAALSSAMGVGSVLGALYSANRRTSPTSTLIIMSFLFGTLMILTAFMPSLLLAIIAMVLVGATSINVLTLLNTTLQVTSAPQMRGRVMSLYNMAIIGTTPIGAPIIGWIGEMIGPRWSMAAGGLAAIIAAGVGFLFLKRMKNHIEKIAMERIIEATIPERVLTIQK